MATVWLTAEESVDLPDVCVKTGRPAIARLSVEAVHRPGWAGLILLFGGWILFFLVRSLGADRVTVGLPVSKAAFDRYRRWQLGTAAVVVAGILILFAGLAAFGGGAALTGVVVAVVGVVAGAAVEVVTWVGLHFETGASAVVITRCHPAFAHAVTVSRGRSHQSEPAD